MTADLRLGGAARDTVAEFFEPRAAAVDRCEESVRAGIVFVENAILDSDPVAPNTDLERVARTIATVACSDLASAFSLWAHRMVLEYLACAGPRALVPWSAALRSTRILGSTALAGPMAHHLGQGRVALQGRRVDGALVVEGTIRWASNLFANDFLVVSAALVEGELMTFAAPGGTPGLRVDPYPELIALQATGSSSIRLDAVRIAPDAVLALGFDEFVARVRPPFLLLQSSFCWGLARRALDEAASALGGPASVFRDELLVLGTECGRLADAIAEATRMRSAPMRELVRVRLDAACLAVAAVALEAKVVGSRSFVRDSATARRMREAAFLPIQTPTEAQLRTELATQEALVTVG